MKHKEEAINKMAKQVMEDIGWTYNENTSPHSWFKSVDEQIEDMPSVKKHPRFEEYKAILFPKWTSAFDFPLEDEWEGRNVMFLEISDETGEPYKISHKQVRLKIIKNEQGKYEKGPAV